ncbi:sensor histidine kinase [Salinisphaera aquimarina]|uniref:histidine kinase n=1 Tax=Salinisphaera aquimarina TaxID=2094031 RepID=A0ABV7ETX6_9GAMM
MLKFIGSHLSLRLRLFLGMLAVTFTATVGFAVAMHEFVGVLEDELLNQTLRRELDSLAMDYREDATIAGKRGHSGQVYVVAPGEPRTTLPRALQRIEAGDYREIHIDGREYFAARRDVDDGQIYFTLDVESIEDLEDRLAAIGWLTLAGAVLLSLIIALVFSFLILRPVRALSARLAGFHPGQVNAPIAHHYSDREMRVIAESFDGLIERFHAFIERERSFTEDAGHELRTPLAVALSANELLLSQTDLSPKTRERAERTQAACIRMQRLVSALLFLARDQPQHGEYCDVASTLDEVLPYYAAEITKKNLSLRVDTHPSRVAAPAGIVDCVLHNLIENAVQHTSGGTVDICVNNEKLVVSDNGEGIAPDALEHIFNRRYRSANSRGFGIGLYLVKRICTRLGWLITVTSSLDAGTRFEISFPEEASDSRHARIEGQY